MNNPPVVVAPFAGGQGVAGRQSQVALRGLGVLVARHRSDDVDLRRFDDFVRTDRVDVPGVLGGDDDLIALLEGVDPQIWRSSVYRL